ncbi:hypothetical protein HL658_12450 [Azospirillum sp. RWY-5-1]|uniref:Uncharacterized protein n=1 Tax=Azospirillum oleiclasticum TaxID=2735135 RepID=A0ABX2TBW5_9PROT|nr:hypothetical protein [Azospirillum oleiclasticum]NYZ13363.1 hypothetical protein [Azospirillum oleiclasticum]NYZ20524.1 hypothetical protein [Azospirillum oleiclasticum]
MRLEDKLAPLRIRRYSDDRTLRMDVLAETVHRVRDEARRGFFRRR